MDRENLKLAEKVFRNARITGELSDSSITKYRDSAKKFFSVVGKNVRALEINDFDEFILAMRDNGASNSRIANVISAIKWIISRLQNGGIIERKLDLEKVRKPKIGKKEVTYLTQEEIRLFLAAIESDGASGQIRRFRARAFFFFLLRTGARIGEVLSVNIDDLDRQNKEVQIIGKGNKPRTLFLTDDLLARIDQYLSLRSDANKALYVSLNGKSRWQQTDAGRSFRRYKKLSGIKKKITIHTLRHTFATQYLAKGVKINEIQFLLGHADINTTLKYYIGSIEKQTAKRIIQDKHFDFIPESVLKSSDMQ